MREKPYQPTPEDWEKKRKLDVIFGPCMTAPTGPESFRTTFSGYTTYEALTLKTLLRVCEIMECTPEELFWNPDLDYSGCYYDGDTPGIELRFEVRRVGKVGKD